MNRALTAFCLKERLKICASFVDQYFQSGVFLFLLFKRKYTFQKWVFCPDLNFYNRAENRVEALAISPCTFAPMSTSIFILRTGT